MTAKRFCAVSFFEFGPGAEVAVNCAATHDLYCSVRGKSESFGDGGPESRNRLKNAASLMLETTPKTRQPPTSSQPTVYRRVLEPSSRSRQTEAMHRNASSNMQAF